MAELKLAKINGAEIDPAEEINRIFIKDAYPGIPKNSTISIKNEATVKVNFEWQILQENVPDKELLDIASQV